MSDVAEVGIREVQVVESCPLYMVETKLRSFLQGQFVVLPAQPFFQPPILLLLVETDVFYQTYNLHEIGK